MSTVSSDVPAELAGALASRYGVRAVLGRGGMATVYLADDRKHRRVVALKVLRPELAASIGAERFLQEIEIVAHLTHPHILSLHDSGEVAGFVYYVMPFIDGGSLRQRLVRNGRMSLETALAVVAPVVDGITYAHRKGVLHRDIKPENILFSDGHAIVADFGIAKAVSNASDTAITRTGLSLGTPGYMSPEQAAGFRDLTERTDVYSLAVLVYEMLVGEIPGCWPSEESVRLGRFLEAATAQGARLVALGPVVEGALVRGLAVRQEQRTAGAAQLLAELRGGPPVASRSADVPSTERGPDAGSLPRRYRADQVDQIVGRAAEMEVASPTLSGAMSLTGVENVAREAGIPSAMVRSAAVELYGRTPAAAGVALVAKHNRLAGGPSRIVFDRVVDGELRDADFPVVVDEIRRALGIVGQVSQLGRSFSWTMVRKSNARREVEVMVTVRGTKTRITVQESLGPLMGGVFGGIFGGGGGGGIGPIVGGLVTNGMAGAIPLVLPLWFATTYACARSVYHYVSRRRERELLALSERLGQLVSELLEQR